MSKKLSKKDAEHVLGDLQYELVKLQMWIRKNGLRVAILFEGRDAAGKGGIIKRIISALNPRWINHVALGIPSEREQTEWYFQRYVAKLPAAGEISIYDRSWYNRAVVEPVMDYCTAEQYRQFMADAPRFEQLLQDSGLVLLKYWLAVSAEEQVERFNARNDNPRKRWKLSPNDLAAIERWDEFTGYIDNMFLGTSTENAPWYYVHGDDKRRARLNCISHILGQFPYEDTIGDKLKIPKPTGGKGYASDSAGPYIRVPEVY
ncbi:MAG: polyphosphate kinase 2 [Ectothiorhodospiraceae bacterium]|nr:polyphosphate kinase 2 [Ectothiorhodospiraceae bacterium]